MKPHRGGHSREQSKRRPGEGRGNAPVARRQAEGQEAKRKAKKEERCAL
jgi:hypothetical protein